MKTSTKIALFLICLFSIILFFIINFFKGGNLNDVPESDWDDTWVNNCTNGSISKVEKYSDWWTERYVIYNFCNDRNTLVKVLETIKNDTIKNDTINRSERSMYSFLWNTKNNHEWKVEYMNDDYVYNIATLFHVHIFKEKDKKRKYISNIEIYPIMLKYYKKSKIEIKKISTDRNQVYQVPDKAFNFFLWYDMETILYNEKKKNPQLESISLFNVDNILLATMTLNSAKNGYLITPAHRDVPQGISGTHSRSIDKKDL